MAPKRKRSSATDEDDIASSHKKRFAYLKPRVRRVAKRTIRSRWSTLPETAQERVQDILRSLERPVIMRHRDEHKRIEAQTAVELVARKYVEPFSDKWMRMRMARGGYNGNVKLIAILQPWEKTTANAFSSDYEGSQFRLRDCSERTCS
jgi:hypothetical protein